MNRLPSVQMSEKSTFNDDNDSSSDSVPSFSPGQGKLVDVNEKRLLTDRQRKSQKRRTESVSDREKRLRTNRNYIARVISKETIDQRSSRLQRNREYKANRRAMNACKNDSTCVKSTIAHANSDDNERNDRMKCQNMDQIGDTLKISESQCHLSLRSLHQTQVRIGPQS